MLLSTSIVTCPTLLYKPFGVLLFSNWFLQNRKGMQCFQLKKALVTKRLLCKKCLFNEINFEEITIELISKDQ